MQKIINKRTILSFIMFMYVGILIKAASQSILAYPSFICCKAEKLVALPASIGVGLLVSMFLETAIDDQAQSRPPTLHSLTP